MAIPQMLKASFPGSSRFTALVLLGWLSKRAFHRAARFSALRAARQTFSMDVQALPLMLCNMASRGELVCAALLLEISSKSIHE